MTTLNLSRIRSWLPAFRSAFGIGFCAACAFATEPAWAAPTPAEVAVAEALFRQGKDLLAAGKTSEACPKLAESQRIDPAGGTLIALALCYEADGKTASAWVVFGEAQAVAEKDGRADRVKLAKDKIATLEKTLSYLTVNVAPEAAALNGLEIKRDGAMLGKAVLGTPVAVDPGKHRISAVAPGFGEFTLEVEVGTNGDRKTALIPALQPAPMKEPAAPAPGQPLPAGTAAPSPPGAATNQPPPEKPLDEVDPGRKLRIAGYAMGGVGIVTAGVGGIFGLVAMSKHNGAVERCPSSPCSDVEGVNLNEAAKGAARASNVLVGVGLGVTAVGVVLLLVAPRAQAPAGAASGQLQTPAARSRRMTERMPQVTAIEPEVSSRGGALVVRGSF
jgi:hypothetical protein